MRIKSFFKYKAIIIVLLIISISVILAASFLLNTNNESNFYWIKDKDNTIKISLKKKSDSCYFIIAETYSNNKKIFSSVFRIDFPVYHFEVGDINNDGLDDIAVGVIKSTYFDKTVRKRPFFFKIVNGTICKLWTGTSLSHPLENFRIVKNGNTNILRSMEREKDKKYLVAEYIWNGFGFNFQRYLSREIRLKRAKIIFNN